VSCLGGKGVGRGDITNSHQSNCASQILQETLHNCTEPVLNELDWPHLGFATGFMNTTEPLVIKVREEQF
jgi:hypothetical protein